MHPIGKILHAFVKTSFRPTEHTEIVFRSVGAQSHQQIGQVLAVWLFSFQQRVTYRQRALGLHAIQSRHTVLLDAFTNIRPDIVVTVDLFEILLHRLRLKTLHRLPQRITNGHAHPTSQDFIFKVTHNLRKVSRNKPSLPQPTLLPYPVDIHFQQYLFKNTLRSR